MARVYCKIEKCRNWKDINDGICPPCITKKKKFADSQKGVQTPIWPCGVCQEPCTDGIRALNCDSCKIWYHTACVDISDEVYDVVMMSAFGKAAKWPCSKCEQRVEELFEKSRTIEDAQEKMVETMGKVIDRLERVESAINRSIDMNPEHDQRWDEMKKEMIEELIDLLNMEHNCKYYKC